MFSSTSFDANPRSNDRSRILQTSLCYTLLLYLALISLAADDHPAPSGLASGTAAADCLNEMLLIRIKLAS
jgi:hypothetical protein